MRKKFVYIVLPLVLIALIGVGYFWERDASTAESDGDLAAHTLEDLPAPAAGADIGDLSGAEDAAVTEYNPEEATSTVKAEEIKITAMGMSPSDPRSIGNINAPVTITEFASMTCPHCAHAHATILPQLIKDYVETGKVRIVFNDFPLNQQALDATKISRCMPADQYFPFIGWAFARIEQWAYGSGYPSYLILGASQHGLTEEKIKSCMADTVVEADVIAGMRTAGEKYKIDSTPTFVFNDGKKIIEGARPYAEFKATIDELLKTAN